MNKLTVALLSGGASSERQVSLNSGEEVFRTLDKGKYRIIRYDPKTDLNRLVADASLIDVALVILHGVYGEDGTVQGLLDLLAIPYQCTGVLGSALAINKLVSKQLYQQSGLPVPPYLVARRGDTIEPCECIKQLGLPLVTKPVQGGSSLGMSVVRSKDSLENALDTALGYDDTILIEKFIEGIELTAGIIGNDNLEALPIIEIIPDREHAFFDFTAKYTAGATQEICPARVTEAITRKAKEYAKTAHKALFCKGYSRTDMILKGNDIYVLETNTIPGMTPTSLLPLAAKTAGISFSRLLDKLIELAIEGHKRDV
jgi:D-alanine-D-alanine ligase